MHQRQESRTTVNFEDEREQSQDVAGTKNGTSRTPKRLSLAQRFDLTHSLPPTPLPIPVPAPVTNPMQTPEHHPVTPLVNNPVLSPIAQEVESSLSHKEEIDSRVKSWRATATPKATFLASTGQVSLDPINMPNTFPLVDPVGGADEVRTEMNLGDYSWSVTSAGPPSIPNSPPSTLSFRPPSVHLDRRVMGSAPLTPETCTSWGPEDYDPLSPISSGLRLPSPDLGQRNLESCPITPTTATSWGPPSEYPPSPDPGSQSIHYRRTLSLDLGQRGGWSRPVTPSTATSWGPPSEYPPSPPLESQWAYDRPPSVDLGRRAEGSRPITPSTMTSWGPPEEWPPTPTTLSRVSTPDAAQQSFSFAVEIGGLVPPESPAPWNFVWPYLRLDRPDSESREPEPRKCVGSCPTQVPLPSSRLEPWKPLAFTERAAYPFLKICERSP